MAIIYLTRFPECPAPSCRVRLLPEGFFPLSRKKRAGNSSLCFVLHHMGFFVRSRLREDPVGSYPAFSPLPSTIRHHFSCRLLVVSKTQSKFTLVRPCIALLEACDSLISVSSFLTTDNQQPTTSGAGWCRAVYFL